LLKRTQDWQISQTALDELLKQLHPDREKAGEDYEKIRKKLISLFEWRGCSSAEEYADLTIDRVARRVAEGISLPEKHYLYFHGVALNLLREYWRKTVKQPIQLQYPVVDDSQRQVEPDNSKKLECLQKCLNALPENVRDLLIRYHESGLMLKKTTRKSLAESLSTPMNALRIRVYRIRRNLQNCMELCVQSKRNDFEVQAFLMKE
jgi:DNA-directed RNA polymerase specialized sigma24 family protein